MDEKYYVVYTSFNGLEVIFIVHGEDQKVKQYVESRTVMSKVVPINDGIARSLIETFGLNVYYAPNWDVETTTITQTVPEEE